MKFAKELFVGALLGGSALSASAVDTVLNFELGANVPSLTSYPGISGLSFANASVIHNEPTVNSIYFSGIDNGDGAMKVVTGQGNPVPETVLTFATAYTGAFTFSYVSYDTLRVTTNLGGVASFASTDGGLNDPIKCIYTTVIALKACNWHTETLNFTGVTSIAFAQASTSADGLAYIDNIKYAVPEPSTYALMALGLVSIGIARRRQMR